MAVIHVLDKHTAELIAAGEVVERPASAVKELVENAIDAGATEITVTIEAGGVRLIEVSDNGSGIETEYIQKAFIRHATSKIQSEADLEHIHTLGFRGEALASIASVAKVEVLTKTEVDEFACLYRIEGGEELGMEPGARSTGTTIRVRDLFYNTPARMKFLKKDASEGTFVADVVNHAALSHPEIRFKFVREGKAQYVTPGDGKLHSAIYGVLGREFARDLIPVDAALGSYRVCGWITPPKSCRASRGMQIFYINGRYVKNRTMLAALENAFKGTTMQGKFPGGVLMLQMPPELVDVNVHPAKTEVRFAREGDVFDAVYHAVKTALAQPGTGERTFLFRTDGAEEKKAAAMPQPATKPAKPAAPPASGRPAAAPQPQTGPEADILPTPQPARAGGLAAVPSPGGVRMRSPLCQATAFRAAGADERTLDICPPEEMPPAATGPDKAPAGKSDLQPEAKASLSTAPESGSAGWPADAAPSAAAKARAGTPPPAAPENGAPAAAGTPMERPSAEKAAPAAQAQSDGPAEAGQTSFLPTETEAPLQYVGELFRTYILAQRGDDEVCLIDKHAAHERILYEKLAKDYGSVAGQLLLAPVAVELNAAEKQALLENREMLDAAGLDVDDFGGNTVAVREVPSDVAPGDVEDLVVELADKLAKGSRDALNEKTEWVLHSIACRAAIKAGDHTQPQELLALAQQILSGAVPPFCPHGRPCVLKLTRKELEKQFGRIV